MLDTFNASQSGVCIGRVTKQDGKEKGERTMVHVRKCPCEYGRGVPTTEFYKDDKPMIYCIGWVDSATDEPLPICKNCKDWYMGEQCEEDFSERSKP